MLLLHTVKFRVKIYQQSSWSALNLHLRKKKKEKKKEEKTEVFDLDVDNLWAAKVRQISFPIFV